MGKSFQSLSLSCKWLFIEAVRDVCYDVNNEDSGRDLWLKLFNAQTEEELKIIEDMEVPVMNEAIAAYRHVAASDRFIQIEKVRSKARHDEAQALNNARRKEREKLQSIIDNKDATIADKDATIANKDAQIAELIARLGESK